MFGLMASVAILIGCRRAVDEVEASEASRFVGTSRAVVGTVAGTKHDASKQGRPTFLDIDYPYPNNVLTVVIFDNDRKKFPAPPETLFSGKRIRVTGLIKEYKGKPEVVVSQPNQIEILDLEEPLPAQKNSHLTSAVDTESSIQLLCNSPLVFDKPVPTTTSTIGAPLLQAIREARSSIDFAIYGLRRQPDVLNALKAAVARGIVVRGVVDTDVEGKNYYDDVDRLIEPLINIRTDQKIDRQTQDMRDDFDQTPFWQPPPEFKGPPQCIGYSLPDNQAIIAVHASREPIVFKGDIMHDKFFVIDHQIVWMGSCNVSDSCSGGYNANVASIIKSSVVAQWYTREFEQMYVHGQFHRQKQPEGGSAGMKTKLSDGTELSAFFSPQDNAMERGVRPILQRARKSIDVAVFYLTHKYITADLISAHQNGIQVRVILDATAAKNEYTKHEILRAAGIPVKVENWGGKMHAKAAVVDGKTLIFGSMNWTSAGERSNDENTVIASSDRLAGEFSTYFEMIWKSIDDRWLKENPDPESRDSGNSWRDGVDNDFDKLVDADDPGTGENPPPMKPLPPFFIVPKEDGHRLIKGAIIGGQRLYYLPTHRTYDSIKINVAAGEQWFPSTWEATKAGWGKAR